MKKRILGLVMIIAPFVLVAEVTYFLDQLVFRTLLAAGFFCLGIFGWMMSAIYLIDSYRQITKDPSK